MLRTLVLTATENDYNDIRKKLTQCDLIPYQSAEKSFADIINNYNPILAIVDLSVPMTTPAISGITRAGIHIIHFDGNFISLSQKVDNYLKLVEGDNKPKSKGFFSKLGFGRDNSSGSAMSERAYRGAVTQLVGTVTIGVCGAGNRTGTTTESVKMAFFLAGLGFKVACVELLDKKFNESVFRRLSSESDFDKLDSGGFKHDGVDFYWESNMNKLMLVHAGNYDYIVIDFGVVADQQEDDIKASIYGNEFIRANMQVITCGAASWDFNKLTKTLGAFKELSWVKDRNVIINFATQEMYDDTINMFDATALKELRLKFFQGDFQPDPWRMSSAGFDLYQELLYPVLPSESPKKSGGWFGRK